MKAKFFLTLTVLFLLSTPLQAKAKKNAVIEDDIQIEETDDLSLFEIDRLIRKTEYDEALRQLNVYIANNPENFDNAQTRIRRIMNARKQYSILAEKLIDLILTDPNNNKEIYEITAQLEKFEKHPSDKNLQFIADLKKSAEFNYFRSLFMELQLASADLTQKQLYAQSLLKLQEGFWLYKEDFYDKWEENTELLAQVDSILAVLDQQIAIFNERNFVFNTSAPVDAFITAVNSDNYDAALAACNSITTQLGNFITVRNTLMDCGVQFENLFAELQQIDEDTTDASFLPFMSHFIFGIESVPNSGIAGAVNHLWLKNMSKMNEAVYAQLFNKYNNFLANLNDENDSNLRKYASLERKLLDINDVLIAGGAENIKSNYGKFYITSDYVENLSRESLRLSKVAARINAVDSEQLALMEQIINPEVQNKSALIKNLFDSTAGIGDLIGVRTQQELENLEWAGDYLAANYSDYKALTDYYTNTLDRIFASSAGTLEGSWRTLASFYKESADNLYKTIQIHNANAEKYLTGFYIKLENSVHSDFTRNTEQAFISVNNIETDENLNFGVYYSYPDISVQMALYVQKEIDTYAARIQEYQKILQDNYSSHEQWTVDENITEIVTSTDSYLSEDIAKILAMKPKLAAIEQNAREQIVAAQLAQNEADIRYAEAEAALKRDNFELARKKLQNAATKYDEALKNQDNAALRTRCDERLIALGDRITKGENEIVVREVRQLKNRAKDAYLNGRFDDAEKYLTEAKQRWAVTNTSEDTEITNLMTFVNTAISMATGREILPSAPQYPEMSQLLNIANQYYNSGVEKLNKGNKAGAEEDLDLALENIQKVQYTYPLNRDASLLTLKINKLKDPAKFNQELSQKIELAKMMCQRKSSQQEGYANLLDYYDIEPNYKGLKNLIYQVEIDIGIRQKPVDNSGERKAQRLFADAQKMFNNAGDDEAKLNAALAKIDEAIALQDSGAAQALKDQITIKIGGNTAVTLSTDDERLYRSAIAKLQANDIFGANVIVQQLLKNPRNAKSQQIKDLKSKVDARL